MSDTLKAWEALGNPGLWLDALKRVERAFAGASNLVIAPPWYGEDRLELAANALLYARWHDNYCVAEARWIRDLMRAIRPSQAADAVRRYVSGANCHLALVVEGALLRVLSARGLADLAGELRDVLFLVRAPAPPTGEFMELAAEPSADTLLWYGGPGGAEWIRSAVVAMTAAVREASRGRALKDKTVRRLLAEIADYLLDTGLASEVGGVIARAAPNPLDAVSVYSEFLKRVYDTVSALESARAEEKRNRMQLLHEAGLLGQYLNAAVGDALETEYDYYIDLLEEARAHFGRREVDEVVAAAATGRARADGFPRERGRVVTALRNLGIINVRGDGTMALTPTFETLIAYGKELALVEGLKGQEKN